MIDFILHLDSNLNVWITQFGTGYFYFLMFLIIFSETGLVVTPFLPGDSLLFALGAISAAPNASINIIVLIVLLTVAAIVGNTLNYLIGRKVGPAIFDTDRRWLKRENLLRAKMFYEKHGGKTVVLSRFLPFFRTFAPFVAGIGQMNATRYTIYNVLGGASWTSSFLALGYFFGNLPSVKSNFHIVIIAIMLISFAPAGYEIYRSKFKKA